MRVVRGNLLFLTVALLVSTILAISYGQSVSAAQITPRTLTLQAGATDGGSKPSGVVRHLFSFTVPTTNNVGSIRFQYCTTAAGTCTMPTGLVTTSATLGAETGATGFTMVNTTNGTPYLTRTASSITGPTALTYRLDTVTNPSATNTSFFVRISTYASTDTTGSAVDAGVVTASTATQIVLTGIMPESIIFCTGATVGINCTSSTSGDIAFNQLFSPTDTATATSQMAASTNAATGYSITVNGPTLTSGANTIPGMAAQAAPSVGTSQFGMNLRANTVAVAASFPGVTADITPSSNGGGLKGQAFTGYQVADQFKYVSGDVVANSSNNGGAPPAVESSPGPTNSQVYTASYIVNVAGNQLAGTYVSTLTYICTATF
jgi:hypothetical protein